jgi:hypothetical protein
MTLVRASFKTVDILNDCTLYLHNCQCRRRTPVSHFPPPSFRCYGVLMRGRHGCDRRGNSLIWTSAYSALAGLHIRRAIAFHLLACRSTTHHRRLQQRRALLASICIVHRDFLVAFASWVFGTEI